MEAHKIKTLSIADALDNLKISPVSALPGDQARQVFLHLLPPTMLDALQANEFYKVMNWEDEHFLPAFCRFPSIRRIISQATGILEENLAFSLTLEFLYKLSYAIWKDKLPALSYPTVALSSTARKTFKDAVNIEEINKQSDYPLSVDTTRLLANIIDTYQLRTFQSLQLKALAIDNVDPFDLLKNQPRFSERMLAEIKHLLNRIMDTSTLSTIYSVIVHGYVDDPTEVDSTQSRTPIQIYTGSMATVIKDYLISGAKPHRQDHHPWTSLKVSFYEDANKPENAKDSLVSSSDLLKEGPINYSHFNFFPFQPANLAVLDDFFERIDKLLSLYQKDIEQYWQAPAPGTGAKKVWADRLKHDMETDVRLRLADTTLGQESYRLLDQVFSHPTLDERKKLANESAARVFNCVLVDLASSKEFPLQGTFLIGDHDDAKANVIVYSLDTGAWEYDNWESFTKELLNQMADDNARHPLLARLSTKHAWNISEFYSLQPARLGVKRIEIQSSVIDAVIDGLLCQQQENFIHNQGLAKKQLLAGNLDAYCKSLDTSLGFGLEIKRTLLLAQRQLKLIAGLAEHPLSYALAFFHTPAHSDLSRAHLMPPALDLPDGDDRSLSDDARRRLMMKTLTSSDMINAIKGVLANVAPYFPGDTVITRQLSAEILNKIITHRLELIGFRWEVPDSQRYKHYFLQQQSRQNPDHVYAKTLVDSASLPLLGITRRPMETANPYYSSQELDTAQDQPATMVQALRTAIAAGSTGIDLNALARYLDVAILTIDEPETSPAYRFNRSYALYHQLFLDLPGFHALEDALEKAAPDRDQPLSITTKRALAVSIITDYLYPSAEQQPGYVCGLNLNSVSMGESSATKVREALQHHISQQFPGTDRAGQLFAFTLLSARFAPELLVEALPQTLLYGQTIEAVHWRHAVACMEAIEPCSSHGMTYEEITAAYATFQYSSLSENKKTALALLKQLPALHFSMCQGVIPETDIAYVSHDNSLKAAEYIKEREDLEAKTFTDLVQIPPQRKTIAREAFTKEFPNEDAERVTMFSKTELNKYFFSHPAAAADKGVGRKMKMTILEKYMSCAFGNVFDEAELGLKPYPKGACYFQTLFDAKFKIYKENFLNALISRMTLSLHDLPELDRNRILNAYKYIKLSFNNNQANQDSYFGMIALYKESDSIQYAYELFSPSGVIRPLPLTGTHPVRINQDFSPDTQDALWHESPYLRIPPLDEGVYLEGIVNGKRSIPDLTVAFYSVRRQTQQMSRNEKIEYLCKKLVDSVFGNIVELGYPTLRSPTPFEAHKERAYNRAVLWASFVFPGYALYQDIKSGKVTVGTVIFGALEALSLLLPFIGLGIKALKVSAQLSRIIITSRSLGFSRQVLAAARAIKPLQNAAPKAFLRSAEAANPLGAVVLMFQAGSKGMQALKFALRFARQELGSGPHLSSLIKIKHLPPIHTVPIQSMGRPVARQGVTIDSVDFFRADFSTSGNCLNIQQQRRLHARGVDLSDVVATNNIYSTKGKTYIYLQENIYEVNNTGDGQYRIHKENIEGPRVVFSHSKKRWEIAC